VVGRRRDSVTEQRRQRAIRFRVKGVRGQCQSMVKVDEEEADSAPDHRR